MKFTLQDIQEIAVAFIGALDHAGIEFLDDVADRVRSQRGRVIRVGEDRITFREEELQSEFLLARGDSYSVCYVRGEGRDRLVPVELRVNENNDSSVSMVFLRADRLAKGYQPIFPYKQFVDSDDNIYQIAAEEGGDFDWALERLRGLSKRVSPYSNGVSGSEAKEKGRGRKRSKSKR